VNGSSSLWRRTQRLEVLQQHSATDDLARRLAGVLGCPPDELLAEARAQERRARAAGVVTRAQWWAFMAAEAGMSVADLERELAWVEATW